MGKYYIAVVILAFVLGCMCGVFFVSLMVSSARFRDDEEQMNEISSKDDDEL